MVLGLVWTVDVTFIPTSSRFSVGMIGLLLTSSINQNRRMKTSFMKCLDHFDEFPGQLLFSPLLFHEIDLLLQFCIYLLHYYRTLYRAELYLSTYLRRQHIHLPHTFLAHSKFSAENLVTNDQMLCGRDTGSTSHYSVQNYTFLHI